MKAIKEHKMAPLYQIYAKDLGWTVDKAMLDSMKEDNAKTLAELDVSIKDAEENLGKPFYLILLAVSQLRCKYH